MNVPQVEVGIFGKELSLSQGNIVIIMVETDVNEILENPITGLQTLTRSSSVSPPLVIDFSLSSTSRRDIRRFLRDKLVGYRWLCEGLASDISSEAKKLGFGRNGLTLNIFVTVTYQNVVVMSDPPPDDGLLLRVVLLGKIRREEFESLNMKTEACSICLDNLSGGVTRMNCSHVFHGPCLLKWLKRKDTCPMCRTVLYDR